MWEESPQNIHVVWAQDGTLPASNLGFFFLVLCCLVFSESNIYALFCFSFQNIHSFPADHGVPWGPVFKALAVCHSLIVWEGKIQGDPLDVKMFEATNWVKR